MAGASISSPFDPLLIRAVLLLVLWLVAFAGSAPYRSKGKGRDAPQLVYDQKQTGDYNIQLHLKDFQIIALLGDDTLSEYDYNYDYADFTIKPAGSSSTSTTTKRSTTTSSTTAPSIVDSGINNAPSLSSLLPSYTINSHSNPSHTTVSNPQSLTSSNADTFKLPIFLEDDTIDRTEQTSVDSIANDIIISSTLSPTSLLVPTRTASPLLPIESMTPGKIKVQIVEAPGSVLGSPPPAVGIVPGEEIQHGGTTILEGEVSNYRKCANGFTRDKAGRCRRIRKPGGGAHQLPFGFARIANSLATKLRLPTGETQLRSSEPTEK
ncbi:uncharacterized protein [Euwallacea fornicatus]|uniref:uncharacterized protein n=1 Tax=Euwallacea fornicatus TaxID=995702 RepID=UPI00338F0174